MSALTATALFLVFGALTGTLHLSLLSHQVRALHARGPAQRYQTSRHLITAGAFSLAAPHGAVALIAMLAGFIAMRTLASRYPERYI